MTIRLAYITLWLCALAALGCTKTKPQTGTDGATHFLRACDASDDCGELACLCGVCSRSCEGDAQCAGLAAGAECLPPSAATCAEAERSCTRECDDDDACTALGMNARCEAGRCVRPPPDTSDAGQGQGGTSGSGASGSGASGSGATGAGQGGRGGATGGGGDASTPVCTAMDAVWDGTECLRALGYAWDGFVCRNIECGCKGDDCDALYPTLSACEDARRGCATPCRQMDARSNGTKCAAISYRWNGIDCDEVLCGCMGSDCGSIYLTKGACEQAHDGCTPLTMCTQPADCTMASKECCSCADHSVRDIVAISGGRSSEFADRVCQVAEPCAQCPNDPFASVRARYLPQCVPSSRWEGGQCQLLDIGALACTQAVGCGVRARTCCECGADLSIENLMAVPNGAGDPARTALCAPGQACDACLPIYPNNVQARCGGSGFCELLVDGVVVTP